MIKPIAPKITPFSQFSQTMNNSMKTIYNNDSLQQTKNDFSWVSNPIIISALDELKQVTFNPKDVEYLKNLQIEPPFKSGKDAVDFIKKSNLRIAFADTGSERIHAQYDFQENKIMLNKKYQNTSDTADILALSEAILHETCHAKDNDGASSIQEELINLATGALAHRYFEKKYPDIFKSSDTLIVKDGVNLYARVFFDNDPNKKALKQRVKQKYGLLPVGDDLHRPTPLAFSIKKGEF